MCRRAWKMRAGAAGALAAVAAAILFTARAAAEDAGENLEQQVKAAYLYKFGNYVEWPKGSFARPDSPVVIGVAGDDAVADALARAVAGRSLRGRPIQVLTLRSGAALERLHILYVGRGMRADAPNLLARTRGLPLLTVTDLEGAPPPQSVIDFVVIDDHVRFEISLAAAASHHLVLGSALLAVAREVRERSQ